MVHAVSPTTGGTVAEADPSVVQADLCVGAGGVEVCRHWAPGCQPQGAQALGCSAGGGVLPPGKAMHTTC